MLKVASNPIDVQDFQFKLQCRLKIFDSIEGSPIKYVSNLIASASRFGLIFAGSNTPQLKVIRFASIEDYSSSSNTVVNYSRREVILPSAPQHINVNCDHTILSVIVERDNCPVVLFYDVKSCLSQNIVILNEVRLSTTQGLKILEASWHPTSASIFTDCKTDGTLGIYELKGKSVDINKLPAESNATCFCWSPKGKQIAVGSKDGKLTHYKPDLKAVKVITAPPFEKPHIMISVQWISTYQFIGIFKPLDDSEDQCSIISIDAPKTGNLTFTNFYDVCYSNAKFRTPQFYMIFEQHWNILIVASSNSMEVGVLALTGDTWVQWTLSDSARAELPLDENREETYPVGIAIDTSSVKPIPWGESSLQPAPSLLILSHQGILCSFKIINLKEGAVGINSPAENFADLSGLGAFTTGSVAVSKSTSDNNTVPHNTQPSLTQNIQQQISNKQIQKETKPIQSAFSINPMALGDNKTTVQTSQMSFQNQQVETPPTQKALSSLSQTVCKNSATNLFGGQVTITPTSNKGLASKSTTAVKGSMLLSNMIAGVPVSVSSDVASSSTMATPKHSNQQLTGVTQPQQKIVVQTCVSQVPSKQQITPENVPLPLPVQIKQSETLQENSEEIEEILSKMIQMECSALEKELKIVLFQGKNIRINLDSRSMDTIVNQTKSIDDFIVELVETSESQSSEIHVLKQNTVQAWAWFEEARSRLKEYQNDELSILLKSKPLDSVSEKHLHTLKQMEYYLDSQLSQAHKALDEQWDKFQEYCRKINRVQLPTMEAIFQTMVKQNAILQKHDFILKYITSQIKGQKRTSLFNHLSKNTSLEDSFNNLKLEPENIYQIYHRKIMNRIKPMPQIKSKLLRRMLQNRDVPHVKVNSKVAKSVLQRTPEKRDTSIFVHMTPTTKQSELVSKTLNFYQSTPLNIKSNNPLMAQITGSALSAFASTNIGISTAKSSSSNVSNSGFETQKSNTYNLEKESIEVTSKLSNSSFVKTPENITNSSSNTGPKTPVVMTTANDKESRIIFQGESASSNIGRMSFGNENSISTSAQSNQKLSFMPTKSTNSTINFVENPITSSNTSKTISNIKVEQDMTSFSSGNIFSSAFTKLIPSSSTQSILSPPTSTNLEKSPDPTVSTMSSLFTMQSSEKLKEMSIEQGCSSSLSSASTKPTLSCSIVTVSTAPPIKPFFTPITSGQLNISVPHTSQQPAVVNSSTPPVFIPLTLTQSSVITLNSSLPSSTSISFTVSSVAKPVVSNILSSSSANSTQSSFSVTAQNVDYTQSKPLNSSLNEPASGISSKVSTFSSANATVSQSGSVVSSNNSSSSSFSFLTGNQIASVSSTKAPLQSNLFNTVSTEFSQVGGNTQAPATTQSLFSNSLGTSATTSGMFGSTTTTTSQIFGSTSTTTSNIFGPTTTTISQLFGSNVATGSGIFSPSTTDTSQKFGSTATTSSTTTSAASSSAFTGFTSTTGPIFGGSAAGVTSTSSGSLFGGSSATNTQSIFNTVVTGSQSVFGRAIPFAACSSFSTASTPIFGNTTVSTAPFSNTGGANFGSVSLSSSSFNVSTSTSAPAFGGSISFGTPPTSSSPSFGGSTFVGNNVSSSPFGVASTSASPFGSTTSTSSLFGNASTAASSPFGGTLTTSAPAFAATSSTTDSLFGKPSGFGQSAGFSSGFNTTQPASTPIFGQTTSGTSSIFGNSTTMNAFGGTTTSSAFGSGGTPFATNSSAGGNSLFEQTNASVFGPPKNIFGGTTTENLPSSFGFGSLNVGTSTQSPFANTTETKSPFGGVTFSNASSTGSLFGSSGFGSNSGSSIFGQSTFGSAPSFGGTPQQPGPFSGGSGSISQAGFGTASFQKPSGFGAPPAFGGSPTFGAAPTFGGAPTFGSTSPFGSPNKVFGSASPTGVFGTSGQQSSGFENLANQNTIGFGNLAQSANNPGQSANFTGSSSFSSWR